MKEKLTYSIPVCDIVQAEATSSFLLTSSGIDPWEDDNDNTYDF